MDTDTSKCGQLLPESFTGVGATSRSDRLLEIDPMANRSSRKCARMKDLEYQKDLKKNSRPLGEVVGKLPDVPEHQPHGRKTQRNSISYIADARAEMSDLNPVIEVPGWTCDQVCSEEVNAGLVHSLTQDPVEALDYGYGDTVEDQGPISAPLDLLLPDEYVDLLPDNSSELRDWWPDYDVFQMTDLPMRQGPHDRASGLRHGLGPWPTSWSSDSTLSTHLEDRQSFLVQPQPLLTQDQHQYQDNGNSADEQLWDARRGYEEEAAARSWPPRDHSFSPSSDSAQSFRCPQGMPQPPLLPLTNICPKPILPRPNGDDENRDGFRKRDAKQGEPHGRRRSSSTDDKDAFLVQSKLAGMSYKQIKEKGHFVEAESTLRGRFRTLTKHKDHRVRKPEWQEGDVSTPVFP